MSHMNASILLAYTLKEKTFHIKHIPTNTLNLVANIIYQNIPENFLEGGIYEI